MTIPTALIVMALSYQGHHITTNNERVVVTPTTITVGVKSYRILGSTFYNTGAYSEYRVENGQRIGITPECVVIYNKKGWPESTHMIRKLWIKRLKQSSTGLTPAKKPS